MTNTWWDVAVGNSTNTLNSLWVQASQPEVNKILYENLTVMAITMYFLIFRRHFFLLNTSNHFIRIRGEFERIRTTKKFLDRLGTNSGTEESVSVADAKDVLVNIAEIKKTDQLTPLTSRTEKETSETVTVTIYLPEIGNSKVPKLVESLKKLCVADAEDGDVRWLESARILQGKVEVRESLLSELQNLYKVAAEFCKGCTLQVDGWGVLMEEGVWQQNVFEEEELPMLFHAEYAAGILTIAGKHLKGVEINVADSHINLSLGVLQEKEIKIYDKWGSYLAEFGLEYCTLPIRLSSQDMGTVLIYASQKRMVEDQSVVIHSTPIEVKDVLCKAVFERWILANLLLAFIIVQVFRVLLFCSNLITEPIFIFLWYFIVFTATAYYITYTESRRNGLKNTYNGFVRGIWTIYFEAADLIRRERHFSHPRGRNYFSRPFRSQPPVPPRCPPSSSSSTSTRSFFNSILKRKEGDTTNNISETWKPCAVEQVHFGNSPLVRIVNKVQDGDDFDNEKNPFVVIYHRKERSPWSDDMNVQVASEHLIKIFQKHLPFHRNLLCSERPEIPGRDVFVVVDNLSVEGAGIKQDQLSKAELHLNLLVQFIKGEYKEVSPRLNRMKQERLVSFDMLWAFFYPGQKVVYRCSYTQTLLCATVAERVHYNVGTKSLLTVWLEVYDFNGRTYRKCNISRTISKFEGDRLFETLHVCPINLMGRPQEVLEAEFLAHGKLFYEFAIQQSYRFMKYQGPMLIAQRRSSVTTMPQENADGRVMIDTQRFLSMNPGFKPLRTERYRRKNSTSPHQMDDYMSLVTSEEDVCDEKLMFAPGYVHGFSFTIKEWGLFKVSGFSEVVHDANAFNDLVMEPEDKSLMYSVVSQYAADPQQQLAGNDPISEKGKGCIILCYGPPGTGKSLTAESVAENLRRPLWTLSLSKLGTAPDVFEIALSRVMNIASMWQAVLLLDEADIFLERRTNKMDLTRNAMIAVFLRQLEYYRGIMFLTTNRVSAIDDAVRSRMSMLMHYRQLGPTQRGQVWKSHLSRAGIVDVPMDCLDELSALEFNGREIRNVIHTAQVSAKSMNETLQMEHVKNVVKVFTRSMNR